MKMNYLLPRQHICASNFRRRRIVSYQSGEATTKIGTRAMSFEAGARQDRLWVNRSDWHAAPGGGSLRGAAAPPHESHQDAQNRRRDVNRRNPRSVQQDAQTPICRRNSGSFIGRESQTNTPLANPSAYLRLVFSKLLRRELLKLADRLRPEIRSPEAGPVAATNQNKSPSPIV